MKSTYTIKVAIERPIKESTPSKSFWKRVSGFKNRLSIDVSLSVDRK